MGSREGRPDTDTDRRLRHHLDTPGSGHFVVVAGAGSGKTTSLIKVLAHLLALI